MALARVCFLAEPPRAWARTDHPEKGPTLLDHIRLTPKRIVIIILAAFGLAGAIAGPAAASPAGAGTSAIVTATRSPDASGTAYAGEITFDHGKWCLGSIPNPKTRKPIAGSLVWWAPCNEPGYSRQWLIDVIHTRAGSLAQVAAASNLDVCFSEGNNGLVVLQPCTSLMDQSWIIVHQIAGRNAWTLDLYGRSLAGKNPIQRGKAVWSKNLAFIVQFPAEQAQTT